MRTWIVLVALVCVAACGGEDAGDQDLTPDTLLGMPADPTADAGEPTDPQAPDSGSSTVDPGNDAGTADSAAPAGDSGAVGPTDDGATSTPHQDAAVVPVDMSPKTFYDGRPILVQASMATCPGVRDLYATLRLTIHVHGNGTEDLVELYDIRHDVALEDGQGDDQTGPWQGRAGGYWFSLAFDDTAKTISDVRLMGNNGSCRWIASAKFED